MKGIIDMNKSILVINTPESCNDCIMFDVFSISCTYAKRSISETKQNSKPDWCPLKEVPGKMNPKHYLDDDAEPFCNGYNACIDEILGRNK